VNFLGVCDPEILGALNLGRFLFTRGVRSRPFDPPRSRGREQYVGTMKFPRGANAYAGPPRAGGVTVRRMSTEKAQSTAVVADVPRNTSFRVTMSPP